MDLNGKAGKFKESEVTILMKLVSKYKDIVENKKTDAVVWKEKQAAWERITQELNALSGTMRTLKNVKGKYENLKKNTKKKFAEEKRNVYKTGGGVGAAVKFTPTDNAIKDIIGVSLEGLYNEFDSDATVVEFNENKENEPLRSPIQSLEEGVHILTNSPGITKKIETSISNDDFNNDSQTQSLTNVRPSNSSYKLTQKKKRKNSLTEDCRIKVNILSEAKLELVELQKQVLENELKIKKVEHEQKIKQNAVEHEMRVEQLRLQNEVLKKQLLM